MTRSRNMPKRKTMQEFGKRIQKGTSKLQWSRTQQNTKAISTMLSMLSRDAGMTSLWSSSQAASLDEEEAPLEEDEPEIRRQGAPPG
mmetsp:Transcript_107733/g.240359  ORF Transcript_107733/g.240359 Transcript_107733/m.240359 type:complete len:87 (-) Transcript_107733:120-380(-)